MKVLVIDDNEDTARPMCSCLLHLGHQAGYELGGEVGISVAMATRPDVIFLDLMMPDVDGFEVLERLRSGGYCGRIVVLSAMLEEEAKDRSVSLGADEYRVKSNLDMDMIQRLLLG